MRVLVTGGAGFLGSHLVERLVAGGHAVVCLDNLSTGRRRNIERLLASDGFEFVEADVVEPLPVPGPLDRIFHLASVVARHAEQPIATLRTGAEGTRRVLDLAAERGAVLVLASTSEVYGDPLVHPQVETYAGHVNPVGPRSSYNEAKRFAEALAVAYGRERGTAVRIARIFNTYGPRMRADDGRVVPTFITRALAGRPLRVFGTGRQTRSFCYVSDMVDGLLRLAEADYDGPVNLGNPDEVMVLDLARQVIDLAGSASGLEFGPMPEDDPVRRRPDISLARRLLGWEPKVGREDGLRRTIAYYRNEEPGI
jgi:dTDP-glucose 4,6-dehydratase